MPANASILKRSFYERDTAKVARDLLGKKIVRQIGSDILAGVINEVEAYYGENDSASHAYRGRTSRNSIMFGQAGMAYVYFVYGMHNMFNIVSESKGVPGAVLVRSVVPILGVDLMILNRIGNRRDISNGPARLCQAFSISRELNNIDLEAGEKLWLEDGETVLIKNIQELPRIGIQYAEAKDRDARLRFKICQEKEKPEMV